MLYYKDISNNPFVFEDNITQEIIKKVEGTHKTKLTKITKLEYEAMIAPTLDQLKDRKKAELAQAYNVSNQLDIAYINTTFQADGKSQDRIVSVLSAGSVIVGFYWLDKQNKEIPMTYMDLQGLNKAIIYRGQANFTKLQGLKTKVRNAKTETTLKKIKW